MSLTVFLGGFASPEIENGSVTKGTANVVPPPTCNGWPNKLTNLKYTNARINLASAIT